jgi:hypothetical protein
VSGTADGQRLVSGSGVRYPTAHYGQLVQSGRVGCAPGRAGAGQDMAIAKTCSEGEPLARAPTGGRSTAASALAGSSGTVTEKMSAV